MADLGSDGPRRILRILSIAGSDSGGGAGIQADLKAFAACGVHGMTAITAITAQNTVAVTAVHTIPPEVIRAQIRAVADDIGVDAVKIGMLATAETIEAVAQALDELPRRTPVVLDPVMVSDSGVALLDASARGALLELLVPRATVVTPNLPEALALLAGEAEGSEHGEGRDHDQAERAREEQDADAPALARRLHALGPAVVVLTGGHRRRATDVFFDGSRLVEIFGEQFPDGAAHGSGCTHSSVLAARLAWGDSPLEAARTAKRRASEAVRDGLIDVGSGAGPVNILGVT